MAQTYPNIPDTTTLTSSRQPLLDRDDAAASNFSGTAFPTTGLLIGMQCYRTDQNKLYILRDLTPTWVEVADVVSTGLAPRATILATSRNFSITGDGTAAAVGFNGSANVALSLVLANSGVTAGTYTKVTVDAKGRVTAATSLAASDIPATLDSNARVALRVNSGADVGARRRFNIIPGSGVSISGVDDGVNEELDITIGVASLGITGAMIANGTIAVGKLSASGTPGATTFLRGDNTWATVAAGAQGGGSDKIFWQNDQTITTNYSIPAGQNAMTAGPVTISTGITVTVPSGSVWTVV